MKCATQCQVSTPRSIISPSESGSREYHSVCYLPQADVVFSAVPVTSDNKDRACSLAHLSPANTVDHDSWLRYTLVWESKGPTC